ncbi:hypothetical protein GCM10009639_47460 [Kitasatospora putterlickiae]|uniref:Uncharacterized protein n=1 Tax=Kitasatospora putterlickiae TaxID=221725 RepID=A0ABN1YBD7_9ACTN
MDDGQDDYREAAERSAHGAPTPRAVAIAYTLALFSLIALATALIASGRF